MQKSDCEHYDEAAAAAVRPSQYFCEVCGVNGPIRMCATCGFVGCCESLNSHDTEHWRQTGHAVIVRLPLGEASWVYCYEHGDYLR